MRTLPLALLSLGLAGCPQKADSDETPAPAQIADPELLQRIVTQQTARTQAMKDWMIRGSAASKAGEKVAFTLAFAQPGKLASVLEDSTSKVAVRFDGAALMAWDQTRNVAQRKDLAGMQDDDKLLLVQQAFGRLFCEGWSPPLLAPSRTRAQLIDGKPTLIVALTDDSVAEQRYSFAPDTLAFEGRSTLDKQGNEVAVLKVLDSRVDPTTGLLVPVRWLKRDAGSAVEITVDSFTVNANPDPASFSTNPPPGVSVAP